MIAPGGQGCCGALALHAGRDREARDFARDLIQAFDGLGRRLHCRQRCRVWLGDEGLRRAAQGRPLHGPDGRAHSGRRCAT